MKGYWSGRTRRRRRSADGWFHTGDLARRRRGRLLLHRRPQEGADHPRRLQRLPAGDRGGALRAPGGRRGGGDRHPAPDARRGGRRRRGAASPARASTPDELRAFVKERVAAYKYPRHVWLVDALPKGPTGQDPQARDHRPGGGWPRGRRGHERRTQAGRTGRHRQAVPAGPRTMPRARWTCCSPTRRSARLRRFFPGRPRPGSPPALAGQPAAAWPRAARPGRRARPRSRPARSERRAGPGDRRFADRAWAGTRCCAGPLQAYLAAGDAPTGSSTTPDWTGASGAGAASPSSNVIDALRPEQLPCCQPGVLKEAIDTGGGNLAGGAPAAGQRPSTPPRLPAMVRRRTFEVGGNLAVTPGSVVLRNEVFELIQYQPADREGPRDAAADRPADDQQVLHPRPGAGPQPHRVPGRPGPAGVRDLLAQPGRAAGHWGFDTYARGDHRGAGGGRGDLRGATAVHLLGACSGGILATLGAAVTWRRRASRPTVGQPRGCW